MKQLRIVVAISLVLALIGAVVHFTWPRAEDPVYSYVYGNMVPMEYGKTAWQDSLCESEKQYSVGEGCFVWQGNGIQVQIVSGTLDSGDPWVRVDLVNTIGSPRPVGSRQLLAENPMFAHNGLYGTLTVTVLDSKNGKFTVRAEISPDYEPLLQACAFMQIHAKDTPVRIWKGDFGHIWIYPSEGNLNMELVWLQDVIFRSSVRTPDPGSSAPLRLKGVESAIWNCDGDTLGYTYDAPKTITYVVK